MSVLSNLIYIFGVILIKIPASYFVDIDEWTLKFIWQSKTQISEHNTEGEEKNQKTDTPQL